MGKSKLITVDDIYIELESIFDNFESGYNRRIAVYKKLNELLPNWEGRVSKKKQTSEQIPFEALLGVSLPICKNCKKTMKIAAYECECGIVREG